MEPILMICPFFRATIKGAKTRVMYSNPFTLVSIIRSQSSITPS